MEKSLFILCLVLFFACNGASAQKNEDNLKPYFFVLLKKGPNRTQDSLTAAKIQRGHLDNINRLAASGKLNVAGPFLDDGDMRGIFVFDCSTEDSVKTMLDADPAINAGRLSYEIHPWMTQKGTCFR
ncbi:MAG TPA: YciI family protein [Chitinophagales bacterium]|nr:YciI family protein [Chitinophagales bacterium]